MTQTLVLFLADDADDQPGWSLIQDNDVIARSGTDPMPDADGQRVIAVAPASLAPVQWHKPVAMPLKQARAVARLAATKGRLDPANDLCIADDAAELDDGHVAVATCVASRAELGSRLNRLADAGLEVDALIPAPMLLPEPETGQVAGLVGSSPVMRDASFGFAAEPELVAAMGVSGPMATAEVSSIEERLLAAIEAPPLNLLPQLRPSQGWAINKAWPWRGIALLAALLGLATLAISWAELRQLRQAVEQLDARAITTAKAVIPSVRDARTAQVALKEMSGGGEFAGMAAQLFSVMRDTQGARLDSLRYGSDGVIEALVKPDELMAEQVERALLAKGFKVERMGAVLKVSAF